MKNSKYYKYREETDMGLSKVRVHIKVSDHSMQKEIEQYIKELPTTVIADKIENLEIRSLTDSAVINPDRLVYENGILSTDKMGFEDFEQTGKEISSVFHTPVMAALVFDSDVAVVQVYQGGQTVLEEVYSIDMKKSMDKERFIQIFGFSCEAEALEEVFAMENVIFAEAVLQKAGEIIGVNLI